MPPRYASTRSRMAEGGEKITVAEAAPSCGAVHDQHGHGGRENEDEETLELADGGREIVALDE